MPFYMDRHDLDQTSAADVAANHLSDLDVQDDYGVRFLAYWFDYQRQAAFCLVDAPSSDLAQQVHQTAHGSTANEIIPVDVGEVERFLGRIEDPTQAGQDAASAFRIVFFSDIEGSTAMTQDLGDDAALRLLGVHDGIVRAALDEHDGREVKHTGDGIMAAFASVTDALSCSIAAQRGLAAHNVVRPAQRVAVRIGLSAGEPVARGDDLFGATVQLASRLCDHADAGSIVVSGVVQDLAIGKGYAFTTAETVSLKGFPEPVRISHVVWED